MARSLKQIHAMLELTPKIYVHSRILNTSKNINDFFINFFDRTTPQTFDKNENSQCDSNCGRSFGDLYALITTVHPKTTPKELAICLKKLCMNCDLSCVNCSTVKGVAFHNRERYQEISGRKDWNGNLTLEKFANEGALSYQELEILINEED